MYKKDFDLEISKACIKHAAFDLAHLKHLKNIVSPYTVKKIDIWLNGIMGTPGPNDEIELKTLQLIYEKAKEGGRGKRYAYLILERASERNMISDQRYKEVWKSLGLGEMSGDHQQHLKNREEVEKQKNKIDVYDLLQGPSKTNQVNQTQEAVQ